MTASGWAALCLQGCLPLLGACGEEDDNYIRQQQISSSIITSEGRRRASEGRRLASEGRRRASEGRRRASEGRRLASHSCVWIAWHLQLHRHSRRTAGRVYIPPSDLSGLVRLRSLKCSATSAARSGIIRSDIASTWLCVSL